MSIDKEAAYELFQMAAMHQIMSETQDSKDYSTSNRIAIKLLRESLIFDPKNAYVHIAIGDIMRNQYIETGDPDGIYFQEAVESYKKAIVYDTQGTVKRLSLRGVCIVMYPDSKEPEWFLTSRRDKFNVLKCYDNSDGFRTTN